MKKLLSFLCAAVLVMALLPLGALPAAAAEPKATKTLYQQILERDGFIEGVWYPWFTHTYLGCGFTSNEMAAQYITNCWYDFNKVGIDSYGADKIYAEIYNLKALGYNMLAIAGSPYGEGVIYDPNGDVLGIKEEYLKNIRRFLDICRDIGMPVMWNINFHTSSAADYYGMDAWNILCRFYADHTVADHYAQRFVKPLCQVLEAYDDVVALIALTDEVENEIEDPNVPHSYASKAFGTTKENILYFVNAINDVVRREVPQIARTIAANSDDLGLYSEVEVDVLGRNRYSDAGTVPGITGLYSTVPMLLTEYNLHSASGMSESEYSKIQIKFRDEMKRVGYQGGFQWCWQPNVKGGAMDLLMAGAASNTDFRTSMYDRYYYTLDAIAAHQGKPVVLDTPALFYHKGDGLLEWIPSRQATTVTIEASTDNGKNWRTVAADLSQSSLIQKDKCVYRVSNASALAIYRITVKDGKGHTATALTNRPGAAADYIDVSPSTSIKAVSRPKVAQASAEFSSTAPLALTSFGVWNNRPATAAFNLIQNGSFERQIGQWTQSGFLTAAVQVVSDATAPEGKKSLHFDTRFTDTPTWYTFTVTVKPNTNYTLSAWVKGAHIADDNRFYGSLGVLNPATKTFATYSSYNGRRSRQDSQIYPPAWDEEWHLRSVTFNSGSLTEVVIGLYGCSTEMWFDDIALYEQDMGTAYLSPTAASSVTFAYDYEYMLCEPSKSLTENVRFEDAKSTYWQSGSGWDNGFLSIVDTPYVYGTSLKYTASANPIGLHYIKWIAVKPNTEYVVTFNYKVLQEGDGFLRLATKRGEGISHFVSIDFIGTRMYEDENGWCTFSTKLDTAAFDRIAVVITDLGGEVLIDNFRLFLPEDGSAVTDLPGGTVGGSTTPPVVRPTTTVSTSTVPTTEATKPTLSPSVSDPSTDDTTVTLPTDGDAVTTVPSAQEGTDPTSPAEGDACDTDCAPKRETPWLLIGFIGGAVLLIGGGVAMFLLLRKKKQA